jgi:hypothetical protein
MGRRLFTSRFHSPCSASPAPRELTLAAIVVLTILAILETSKPGQDVGIEPMAVFAILYVLCAVLVPLLRRADLEGRRQR